MGVAAGRIDAQPGIARLFLAGTRVEVVRHAALDQLCHKACTRAGVPLIGDGKGKVEGSCRVGRDGQRHRKRQIGKSAKRSARCIPGSDAQLILRGDFREEVLFIPCRFISIIPRSCYIKLRFYHFLLFGREGIPAGVRNKPVFGQGSGLGYETILHIRARVRLVCIDFRRGGAAGHFAGGPDRAGGNQPMILRRAVMHAREEAEIVVNRLLRRARICIGDHRGIVCRHGRAIISVARHRVTA